MMTIIKKISTKNYLWGCREIRWRKQWHPTPVLLPGKSHGWRSLVGCGPWGRWKSDTAKRLDFHFHTLEKEMATHSSVLAWRIPGTGEHGGLPSMGSHRVRHDWSDLAAASASSSQAGLLQLYWELSYSHVFIYAGGPLLSCDPHTPQLGDIFFPKLPSMPSPLYCLS